MEVRAGEVGLAARLSDETTILISGIRGKIDSRGEFTDEKTQMVFRRFVEALADGLLKDSGEGRAGGDLLGDRQAADDGGIAADEAEGVLVEDGGHRFIEFGQLMTELNRAFEEDLDGYGPKFVIVGRGIVAEQVPGAGLLHGGEDGPGHF